MLINTLIPLEIESAPVSVTPCVYTKKSLRTYKSVVRRGGHVFGLTLAVTHVKNNGWYGSVMLQLFLPSTLTEEQQAATWLQQTPEESAKLYEQLPEVSPTFPIGSRWEWKQTLLRRLKVSMLAMDENFHDCKMFQYLTLEDVCILIEALIGHYKTHGELPLPLDPTKAASGSDLSPPRWS